jgi:hypothetical protein
MTPEAVTRAFEAAWMHGKKHQLAFDLAAIDEVEAEDSARMALESGLIHRSELAELIEAINDNRQPPVINVSNMSLTEVVDLTIKAAARTPDLYQRGGKLVDCVRSAEPDGSRIVRPNGLPRIRIMPRPRLAEVIGQAVQFKKWQEKRCQGVSYLDEVDVPPPGRVVNTLEARGQWEHIRPLAAVVDWPILRPDGTVLSEAGYDPRTHLYLSSTFAMKVPENPTLGDAKEAVAELLEAVQDFKFLSDAGRAGWLAMLLTLVARHAIAGPTPLFLIDANVRGAGKGLLCDAASVIVTGKPTSKLTAPSSEEEWTKLLSSVGLAGDAVMCIDNVTSTLRSQALDTILTSTHYDARILGKSETAKIPWTTMLSCTSNNAQLSPDLVRRTIQIRLEIDSERPELRSDFRHPDLLAYCLKNRDRLLTAALVMLRAYQVAPGPPVKMRSMGSFERWSAVVRAALVWAGQDDPAETQDALRESADSEREPVENLLRAWNARYGTGAVTGPDIIKLISNPDEPGDVEALRDAVVAFADARNVSDLNPRKLGAALGKIRGRPAAGFKLTKLETESAKGTLWSLLPVR